MYTDREMNDYRHTKANPSYLPHPSQTIKPLKVQHPRERIGVLPTIEAKMIARKLEAYCSACGESVKQDNSTTHQKYSKEAFVDAIVEWIVTDDQVSWF